MPSGWPSDGSKCLCSEIFRSNISTATSIDLIESQPTASGPPASGPPASGPPASGPPGSAQCTSHIEPHQNLWRSTLDLFLDQRRRPSGTSPCCNSTNPLTHVAWDYLPGRGFSELPPCQFISCPTTALWCLLSAPIVVTA